MPSRSAITLLHVRGIRIGVDYSWFFVLFLVIVWLSGFYGDVLGDGRGSSAAYVLSVLSALLFFASILLHELGHAFAANRRGIPITEITLWMFGGVARMERDSDSPATEFKIAVAGPLVTAIIVLFCTGLGVALAGADDFRAAMLNDGDADVSGSLAMLGWLAEINLLVLIFNLVPAFPLDGGRIARAIAWWRTGDRGSATRIAATLGRGFAYLLIGLGLFFILSGLVFTGVWAVVIGFVLNGSARGAILQSELTRPIEGLQVADVMDREPVAIPAELSVERALEEYFLRYGWPWFPVIDAEQRFCGLLDRGTADSVPEVERRAATVQTVLAASEGSPISVSEEAPLEAVLSNQSLRNLGALVAVDADGRLRGVITADAIGRALRNAGAAS